MIRDIEKLVNERVSEIFDQGYTISLGVCDEKGPWVANVIYVVDEKFNIYWISSAESRHSKAIMANGKAAATVIVSNEWKSYGLALQIEGAASKVKGSLSDLAMMSMTKRGHMDAEEYTKTVKSESWYVLKPSKIYLIDEENFGFKRQEFKF